MVSYTHMVVVDTSNFRIVKRLLSDLSYDSKIGSDGVGDDQFNYPFGVDADET